MKNLAIFIVFTSLLLYVFNNSTSTNSTSTNSLLEVENNEDFSENQVVRINGLNSYNEKNLISAKKIIEDNFHFTCVIGESILTEEKCLCEDIQIELGNQTGMIYNSNEIIDIYITNSNIFSLGKNVKGVCYGNQIYVQSYPTFEATLIHELTHIYIYDHCKNECVMNSFSHNRWDNKSKKPIYCKDCKSKLPQNI